jgi:hypothetical protein
LIDNQGSSTKKNLKGNKIGGSNMDKSTDLIESVIFSKGEKPPEQFSKYFTGNIWLNMLVSRGVNLIVQ